MEAAREAIAGAPGCLVVTGERMAGVTRGAFEVMRIAERAGARLVWAEAGSEQPLARLGAGLAAVGLPSDPVVASATHPFAAYLGSCGADVAGPLARALAGTPGLVVCESTQSAAAPTLRVVALDAESSRRLVETVDPTLDAVTIDRIVALSDGLPGCLVAFAQSGGVDRLPSELETLIQARLNGVTDTGRLALVWAAVLGSFDAPALASVAGLGDADISPQLTRLVQQHVIVRDARPPRFFRLAHELTRWVIAERRLEAFTGVALRDEGGTALVGERLRLAQLAYQALDHVALFGHVDAAEREWRPEVGEALRRELLITRGSALERDFRLREALATFNEVRSSLDAGGHREQAEQWRMRVAGLRSRLGAEFVDADQGPQSSAADPSAPEPSEGVVAMRAQAAVAAMRAFRHREAIALGEWVLEHSADPSDSTRLQAKTAVAYGRAMTTPTPRALAVLSTVRQEALSAAVPDLAVHMANYQMTLLGDLYADYAVAKVVSKETVQRLHASGLPDAAALVEFVLALVLIEAGDLTPLGSLVQSYDERGFEFRTVDYARFARLWLARATGHPDDLQEHLALLDMGIVDATPDMLIGLAVNLILSGLGMDSSARDDHSLIPRALAIHADDPGSAPLKLLLFVGAVERDLPPGREAWRDRLAGLDRCQAPAVSAHCVYADAFLEATPSARVAKLRAAAAGFEQTGMKWWAARALLTVGIVADDDAAVEDLLAARTAFATIGADGWRERAEAELRGRGIRWTTTTSRNGLLSERELEIVRELAAGRSNAEIAERLVLSQNTVARHLTRIYRKLGVSGRADAISAGEHLLRPE